MEPTVMYATGDKRNVMHHCTVVLKNVFSIAYVIVVVVVGGGGGGSSSSSSSSSSR
jgi:hypothetical protein